MIGVFDGKSTRREMLCAGALGSLGLSLPQLLQAEETRRGHSIKSCIVLFAFGGPAQHETFDMKPDAPYEIRGAFRPIQTNVNGIQVSEYLPRLAKLANHLAIIRSATHKARIHNPGCFYALTGRAPTANVVEFAAKRTDFPGLGSIYAKLHPGVHRVPPYVIAPIFANDVGYGTPGQHGGFLGSNFDPFVAHGDPSRPNYSIQALQPQADLDADRFRERRRLLTRIEEPIWTDGGQARNLTHHVERAFDLVSSSATRRAFDLSQEPVRAGERYGMTRFCQSVLLARRLVESGVRLVLVNDAEDSGQNKRWDTHGGGFGTLRRILPETDNAFASLIEDLRDRGLLDSTLIVWMGEFGRSPRIDSGGGRDHWPDCYSLVMAGGGIRGGQTYGASDTRAAYVRDLPVTPEDIHATIYHALGIPQDAELRDALDRPIPLYLGRPIMPLFA